MRKRDCWLTKKTMHGCTTLQLRWAIVHIYQIEGLRGLAAIGRRFQELFPGACRGVGSKRRTCQRVVQLWLRTGLGRMWDCLSIENVTFCTGMASEYLGNLKGAKLKVK